MGHSWKEHLQFRPQKFDYLWTQEKLTRLAGLGALVELFDADDSVRERLRACLPERTHCNSLGSYRLALGLISAAIYGMESLSDLQELREDEFFTQLLKGRVAAPTTVGDFLRDFKQEHIDALQRFLSFQSQIYGEAARDRVESFKGPESVFWQWSQDSTHHVHWAKKMEGLAYNYKGQWCLESQSIFDWAGFCCAAELRPGASRSGYEAERQIHSVFSHKKQWLRYREGLQGREELISADSAYCHQKWVKACLSQGLKFSVTANHAYTSWKEHIAQLNPNTWEAWEYSQEELQKYADRGEEAPKIELSSFILFLNWSGKTLAFPVVVKREPGKTGVNLDLFKDDLAYDDQGRRYYGVMTNLSLLKHSKQEILEQHFKRARCEQMIKEEKYNYDLKHFPCQKLDANRVYFLFYMIAHNIMRMAAILDKPEAPCFARQLRRRFVFLAGKATKHARQFQLKLTQSALKEVKRIVTAWEATLTFPGTVRIKNTS